MKTIGIIIRKFNENNKGFIGTREVLFKSFSNYDVNIIGILINISFNTYKYFYDIYIDKKVYFIKFWIKKKIIVNSRHKSAIFDTNIFVSSKSEDGVIEELKIMLKKFWGYNITSRVFR